MVIFGRHNTLYGKLFRSDMSHQYVYLIEMQPRALKLQYYKILITRITGFSMYPLSGVSLSLLKQTTVPIYSFIVIFLGHF